MARARPLERGSPPEILLQKATFARTAGLRAKYATRGLAAGGADRETQALLLRQLYLAHVEARRFEEALHVAEQTLAMGVLPDVAHQDTARACLALDRVEEALEHVRLAGRKSPASRRAFHLWTLGSMLYLLGRHRDAVGALVRAVRWGTTAKPLYEAQLALARLAAGDRVRGLSRLRERLEEAPCGQGYGQFVLGELCARLGDRAAARKYLGAFVRRTTEGRVALAVSLRAEIERARGLLAGLSAG